MWPQLTSSRRLLRICAHCSLRGCLTRRRCIVNSFSAPRPRPRTCRTGAAVPCRKAQLGRS
eukprot:2717123-Pyramimonas_sp.AAC.1